jgi:prolyl-tRNA editing enzyme YbaK/EbsC (Cys-tRNA(Pro) deacylase)
VNSRLSASASRVQAALDGLGLSGRVRELPETTRSAREAAAAIGCRVEEIVKSLVFRTRATRSPLLVLVSGASRVDEHRLAALLGEPVERADADYVREETGYSIGGVPPLGHPKPIRTLIDEGLLEFERLWAAAGTPYAVFSLTPAELRSVTAGEVAKLSG